MKKIENYSVLWQKKRDELPIDGDPNMDWLQMRSVLDSYMPSSGPIKKPYNPGRLKLLYKLIIAVSATVSIYGGAKLYLSKKQNDGSRHASVKESHVAAPLPDRHLMPVNTVIMIDGSKQLSKTVTIKNNHINVRQRNPGNNGGKHSSPFPVGNSANMPVADTVAKRADGIGGSGGLRRDSVLLPVKQTSPRFAIDTVGNITRPLNPADLNNKAIQKAASDSVKQLKKKKRSKIGVFL